MTEAHIYSNFCPYFSVWDLEIFNQAHGRDSRISTEALRATGFEKAARWLEFRQSGWENHRKIIFGKESISKICWGDAAYPRRLSQLGFPPSILFCRGNPECLGKKCVSIVGARHPTELGRMWVREAVKDFVKENFVIVSGGARGIDTEAHAAALNAAGESVGFLPGGVDNPYPYSNISMFNRMIEKGAILSEFPPGYIVRPENFHRRNRLIAGASEIVVIVEAGLKSGTMMTAHHALAENREVLVVPGPPMVASYAGSLELLNQGAGLARSAQDVIKLVVAKSF